MPSNVMTDESGDWLVEFLKRANSFDLGARVERMLESLTPEEASILRKRLGLGNETAQSRDDLAQALQLSPPEIAEIERRALYKLKHPSRSSHPRTFVDQE
jgi:DNA-directed RNA polymerase sigma subunit (sigma70/sigma32)